MGKLPCITGMVPLYIQRITLVLFALLIAVSGRCTNPRVRREWRSISAKERACWINAIKCLAKLPQSPKIAATVDPAVSLIPPKSSDSSYYDDFVYVHMDLNPLIHETGFFLPWHRMYVHILESALRSKCGYDGVHPYWDWTKDTADFYHATIFSNSTFDGLGAWGDPNNDFQVSTGGLKDIRLAYPVPHYIRRNFTNRILESFPIPPGVRSDPTLILNNTFTADVVHSVVNSSTGNFILFQAFLEGIRGPHPGPHLILGGEMGGTCPFGLAPPACNIGPRWSPNDPLFYLHHAMIDKLWYDWQHRDSRNKYAFAGGSISWQVNRSLQIALYPTGGPPFLNVSGNQSAIGIEDASVQQKSSIIPGNGLWKDVRVRDVMDTVGGRLCYVYA